MKNIYIFVRKKPSTFTKSRHLETKGHNIFLFFIFFLVIHDLNASRFQSNLDSLIKSTSEFLRDFKVLIVIGHLEVRLSSSWYHLYSRIKIRSIIGIKYWLSGKVI